MTRLLLALLLPIATVFAQGGDAPAPPNHAAEGTKKMEAEDYAGAEEAFTKAIEVNPTADAYTNRGLARLELKRSDDAIADLSKAIELDSESRLAHWARAIAYERAEALQKALADLDRSAELMPGNPNVLARRGALRERTGDYDGAIEDYSAFGMVAPEHPAPYESRARAKAVLGRHKEALLDYEAAIFNGATGPGTYIARARSKLALGDKEGAEADLKHAAESAPDSPDLFSSRGYYRLDRGDAAAAVADLRKAVAKADDDDPQEYARLYLAVASAMTGAKEAAQKDLAAYLAGREEKGDWYAKVAGFLSGALSEADFLAATADEHRHLQREHRCEAYWYAGAMRLAAGDEAKAKEYFEVCRKTDVRNFIEYASATAYLARLTAEPGE